MVLQEGQLVGPYRLVGLAGSGGMGEVWRARDARLERDVALKVLHAGVGDEEARRRLLAEARAVTALNHPHIIVVHDLLSVEDRDVLVMEFVGGEVLSQRIPPGGMKLRDALKLAISVADAVAAAHAAGVIHRDLKPGNVLVGPSGPKVLDFGLARRRVGVAPSDMTVASSPESVAGLISGTPAYMSPEHAEGGTVDHRSDIFSFGAMLYEMLTGRRAFEEASVPETLTAVLKRELELPVSWSTSLAGVVRRCLRKDPARRFQSMGDVKIELQEVLDDLEHGTVSIPAAPPKAQGIWKVAAVASMTGAVLVAAVVWGGLRTRQADETWTVLPLSTLRGLEQQPVLSPAGDHVAFMWDGDTLQNHDIYVQQVTGATPPLRVTTDPAPDSSPCWSPDGRQLAFLRLRNNVTEVMIASPLGGSERRVGQIPRNNFSVYGLMPPTKIDWSSDGRFIVLGTPTLSLLKVQTGDVVQFRPAAAPGSDRDPAFSPDGRAIAYTRGGALVHRQIWLQRIRADGGADGAPTLLAPEFRSYVGITWLNRHSVITAAGWPGSSVGLYRVGDDGRLRPQPIESVAAWYPNYAPGQQRLVYQRRIIDTDIVRIALGDHPVLEAQALIASTFQDREAKYSPDGTKIVFISTRNGQPAVWRSNSDGSNQVLIGAVDKGIPGAPRWSPDGQSIVFDASSNETGADVYVVAAEGGTPRKVTSVKGHEFRPAVSNDGQWIYYGSDEENVWKIPLKGGEPVRVTRGAGGNPLESLDGRWVYYSRDNGVWRVPTHGGSEELFQPNVTGNSWTLSAEALFVLRLRPGQASEIAAYDLQSRKEKVVFRFPSEMRTFSGQSLDVTADGRFALIAPLIRDESDLVVVDGVR